MCPKEVPLALQVASNAIRAFDEPVPKALYLQMQAFDAAQVLLSVLQGAGFSRTDDPEAADVVLLNTCAIREGAEQRIWGRLGRFKALKAERRSAARRAGRGCVTCTEQPWFSEVRLSSCCRKGRRCMTSTAENLASERR